MFNLAKNGDKVKVHFIGKTREGNIFASTHGQEPLEFTVGDGTILPGFDQAITGMKMGEHKVVQLPPQQGFGIRHQELILTVEKKQFPSDFNPHIGLEFQIPQPDGSLAFFKVLEVQPDTIILDANHPLAGETITFELQLLEIQ